MITVSVITGSRKQMVDVTADVRKVVNDSGIKDGLVIVYVPHTTAGITINENADPDVCRDILGHLAKMVPVDKGFRHAEGNSDAHIQAGLMGSSVMVMVEEGLLVLGTWQSIFFCEFDGPRTRKLHVKVLPASSV